MSIVLLICMSAELLAPADVKPNRPARHLFDGIQLERGLDRKPPPEDVEGEVIEVFDDNLVLVSLGSKELRKGMQVEVYRIDPKPVYVGTAQVTAVGERFSLVRLAGKRAAKVGDLVTGTLVDE